MPDDDCDRCGVPLGGEIYCPACQSCQHCGCCPCYKVGCEWCPWDGRREGEIKDKYFERVQASNAAADA